MCHPKGFFATWRKSTGWRGRARTTDCSAAAAVAAAVVNAAGAAASADDEDGLYGRLQVAMLKSINPL